VASGSGRSLGCTALESDESKHRSRKHFYAAQSHVDQSPHGKTQKSWRRQKFATAITMRAYIALQSKQVCMIWKNASLQMLRIAVKNCTTVHKQTTLATKYEYHKEKICPPQLLFVIWPVCDSGDGKAIHI